MAGIGTIKLLGYSPHLRGKRLSPEEKDVLVRLCISSKDECPFSEHRKGFWIQMSDRFEVSCGRSYSWQSCRRQLIAWENRQPLKPEATNNAIRRSTPMDESFEEEDGISYESENDDNSSLPEPSTPAIRRGHAVCNLEKSALRDNIATMVSSALEGFESQLQAITTALDETPDGQSAIYDAFNALKAEIQMSVERYTSQNSLR